MSGADGTVGENFGETVAVPGWRNSTELHVRQHECTRGSREQGSYPGVGLP
jgi:hypothetical protein